MAAILQSVQGAFTSVPHEAPKVTRREKILLAVSGASAQMPDHRTGFFWSELEHPWQEFTSQGFDCDIVSENGQAIVDEASVGKMASGGDKKKWEDKQFPLHAKLAQIKRADQIDPNQYAAIFFAGGHATCIDFPTAVNLKRIAASIYENGGVVGAVCHGPAIFENLRLSTGTNILHGKKATGFSENGEKAMGAMDWVRQNGYKTMEEVVRAAGGDWHESANPMADYTQTSDRIVTGMNPASAKSVAHEMMKFMPENKSGGAATAADKSQGGILLGSGTHDKQAAARFADKEENQQWKGEQAR